MVSSKNRTHQTINKKGFTLIELLIVIAILAVLMSVIVITLNPSEMLKKSRDSRRISDLAALRTALNLYLSEDRSFSNCNTSYAYISVPAASAGVCITGSCAGKSGGCYCQSSTNFRKIDGNGWIPVVFSGVTMGSPISSLPIDPINSTSSGYYYIFGVTSSLLTFELNAKLESTANASVMSNDGGNSASLYEIGSDLYILN